MKGKIKLKCLIIGVALIFAVLLSSLTAFASGGNENLGDVGNAPQTEAENTENVADTPIYTENSPVNVGGNANNSENLFEEIYLIISEYAAEILSTATLLGTLIIGFAYKKGLIPLMRKATGNIQSAVIKIKEDTENGNIAAKEGIYALGERLLSLEDILALTTESIEKLEKKLSDSEKEAVRRRISDALMRSQVDMLYEIFMSSALPQYQKDSVGMRIQGMREELAKYEKCIE